MSKQKSISVVRYIPVLLVLTIALFATSAPAQTVIANNTPKFVRTATRIGAVDPSTVLDVTIWLKPHNKAGLDALAKDLYDSESPNYRHFLTKDQFAAEYAPSSAELNRIYNFATAHHLGVAKIGPNNFYVRVTGTAAAIGSAFHVSLSNYNVDGAAVRANEDDPQVEDDIASLVGSVEGLDSMAYSHPLIEHASGTPVSSQPSSGDTSVTSAGVAEAAASDVLPASSFNSNCFTGTTTQTYTTESSLPKVTVSGNEYNPIDCGYTPQNIRAAYGLNSLYAQKYDGAGQTIVIIDWCGSPTIQSDANVFNKQFGLPTLTSTNFQIIKTGVVDCAAPSPEINLDVEWAHAIAPGAKIDLVVPPSANFQDIDEAFFYAANEQLGSAISGSYGAQESQVSSAILDTENLIAEIAAVNGISANFSSGDAGDFTYGFAQGFVPDVSTPADLPYATAVGGVSLALQSDNSIAWQTGWGMNVDVIDAQGYIWNPPSEFYFFFAGSGGGKSAHFSKPSFQKALPGQARMLPDISWLADPYTGVYIAISEPGIIPALQYETVGGTSLACPMFSALWAIANQIAGKPLGQAAAYVYDLPASAVTDIVPYTSKTNATAVLTTSSGKTSYSAASLAGSLIGNTTFFDVIQDVPLNQDSVNVLTFGTDSGLVIKKGWDDVTGVGVPNPAAFPAVFKP